MPKVHISGQFISDHALMVRIIDAGYLLKNRQYNPLSDTYTFDIEGPDVPESEYINLMLNDQGRVWCEPEQKLNITLPTDRLSRQIEELLKKRPKRNL